METKKIKIKFRQLSDGENIPWQQATNFAELVWSGVYEIRVTDDDMSHGLPFSFADNDKVTLVVKDHAVEGTLQRNRNIVQTLTRIECSTGNVLTYTRTRSFKEEVHEWSEWDAVGSSINVRHHVETTKSIFPNELNIWGEVNELNITLVKPKSENRVNEYVIQFTSGAVPTMLTLPDDIRWANDSPPTIAENMIYQISILNGLAVCLEFSNYAS